MASLPTGSVPGFPTNPSSTGSPNTSRYEEQTPDNMDDYPGDPNIAGSDQMLKPLADWQAGPMSYMIDNDEDRNIGRDPAREFSLSMSQKNELVC